MSIVVDFDGVIATINNGEWSTDKSQDMDKSYVMDVSRVPAPSDILEETLNVTLESDLVLERYGTIWARDVDYYSAKSMAKRFGGKITDLSKHKPPDTAEVGAVN